MTALRSLGRLFYVLASTRMGPVAVATVSISGNEAVPVQPPQAAINRPSTSAMQPQSAP